MLPVGFRCERIVKTCHECVIFCKCGRHCGIYRIGYCHTHRLCYRCTLHVTFRRCHHCHILRLYLADYLLTVFAEKIREVQIRCRIIISTAIPVTVIEIVICLGNIHVVFYHLCISVDNLCICGSFGIITVLACKRIAVRNKPTEKCGYRICTLPYDVHQDTALRGHCGGLY